MWRSLGQVGRLGIGPDVAGRRQVRNPAFRGGARRAKLRAWRKLNRLSLTNPTTRPTNWPPAKAKRTPTPAGRYRTRPWLSGCPRGERLTTRRRQNLGASSLDLPGDHRSGDDRRIRRGTQALGRTTPIGPTQGGGGRLGGTSGARPRHRSRTPGAGDRAALSDPVPDQERSGGDSHHPPRRPRSGLNTLQAASASPPRFTTSSTAAP